MAKGKGPISSVVNLAVWLTGVLVSLAVGFGMADKTLTVKYVSDVAGGIITVTAGWIVIILTLVSVLLAVIDKAN